jgi:type IV pilus assembly protein PilQ
MKKLMIVCVSLAVLYSSLSAGPLDTNKRLSMAMESVPIAKVLGMIAAQNQLNLVMSDDIEGDITLQLEDVDLRTALDAILTANGYAYVVRDNVIIVTAVENASAETMASRVVTLSYLDPVTAKAALESRKSLKGQVIILDRVQDGAANSGNPSGFHPNRLLITDYPAVVIDLAALLVEMDAPERVVQIEARIVETKLDSQTRLGFAWPSAVSTKIAGAVDGVSSGTGTSVINTSTGSIDLETGRWIWGTLSVDQLSAVLNLLEQNGNSKLLSDPKLVTVENHEAEIKIATVIPVQTINRFTEAAATQDIVTFQDFEVGISLKVTPRINGDGNITLDVEPTVEDIIGYSGPVGNQKPITTTRSVRTRVTVKDGETAAIGGLLKEDVIQRTQRFPLLGHIPLLGKALFTNTSSEKSTTDLIILITPHVLP